MGYKGRGSHKKFTSKGMSRYVATEEEVIARNKEISDGESRKASEYNEHGSDDSSDNSEEEDNHEYASPPKKFEPLIEVYNPNKSRKSIEKTGIVELSRREKEELKRQKFEREKMRLMAEGKLASARADLARLAVIRKQREEALARKMEKLNLEKKN